MNEYQYLTPEQAFELLKEENQLYAEGFNERQVKGILQAKAAGMLAGKNYQYDKEISHSKLGTMAIGAWMLLGLAYAAAALYGSCADPNYSKKTQDTIEQRLEDSEMRK